MNISFGPDPPDYAGIAVAAAGASGVDGNAMSTGTFNSTTASASASTSAGGGGGTSARRHSTSDDRSGKSPPSAFMYAAKARNMAELEAVLPEAVRWVREERGCGIVDAWLDWKG